MLQLAVSRRTLLPFMLLLQIVLWAEKLWHLNQCASYAPFLLSRLISIKGLGLDDGQL